MSERCPLLGAHIPGDWVTGGGLHCKPVAVQAGPFVDEGFPVRNIGIEADHVVRPKSRVDGLNDLLVGNLPVVPCGAVRLLPEPQFEGDMIADPDGDNGRRVFGAATVHASTIFSSGRSVVSRSSTFHWCDW